MNNHKYLMAFAIMAMLSMAAVCRADDGAKNKITLQHDSMDSLRVTFVTGDLNFGEVLFAGERFATLSIDGYVASEVVGSPELPVFSQLIEVPLCQGFEVRVGGMVFDTVDAPRLPLMPAQPPRRKSDTSALRLVMNREVYATGVYFGVSTALVEPVGVARDRNLARLQFSPVRYNPVDNKLIVCREATVTVVYRDADASATKDLFDRYYTPAFNSGAQTLNSLYPKNVSSAAPVRYLIVSHSMFREHLEPLIQWKRRKGFLVDVVYTDNAAVGSTTTSIAAYIKSQYTNATATNPAPTYLLLVGDVAQIPAFSGTTNNHYTDLYYTTWSNGDSVPDCYHGRFSAQNLSQLTPQIEKTLMYEQYTFSDPSFLDRAVMVAGVDAGNTTDNAYTYGDPSMDYVITHYINGSNGFQQVRYFKNNTSIVPAATNVVMGNNFSSNSAFVRNCYYEGAGLINYTAHGSSTSWATPYFGVDNVSSMSNYQKFGLMIGNCCESNTFYESECLGEALLRKGNYCGAVGYIGGSNSTYWTYDFYWTVGARSNVGPTMSLAYSAANLGAYDRMCHTHGESYTNWATTQGGLMMAGNMSVNSKVGDDNALYYWEIYHLMGDPSVMPYLTQASIIDILMQPVIAYGSTSFQVTSVPYAYVALTDTLTGTLVASAFADATGVATLTLPSNLSVGGYEVAVSAQQYRTTFRNIDVVSTAGSAYAFASDIVSLSEPTAGGTVQFDVQMENIGLVAASNVLVQWTCDNPLVSFISDRNVLQGIGANQTQTLTAGLAVVFGQQIEDGTFVHITATTTWGNRSSSVTFPILVNAPKLVVDFNPGLQTILPGYNGIVEATISNQGHATLPSSRLKLVSSTMLVSVTDMDTTSLSIAPGSSVIRQYTLHVDSRMPQSVATPLKDRIDGFYSSIDDTVWVVTSGPFIETFEGGTYHSDGWTQGNYPWEFTSSEADGGTWSLRSKSQLGHRQSSEVNLQCSYLAADSIRFRYKVSSEANYDKFYFYIDNEEQFSASGLVDWTTAVYPVSAGTHTFRFSYQKDRSVSDNSDCAWIDNVVLPSVTVDAVFLTDTFCTGQFFVFNGDTVNTSIPATGTLVANSETDGVTVLDYAVRPPVHVDTVMTVCDSLRCGELLFTESGHAEFTIVTSYGCDSSVTLDLTVNHSFHDTTEATVTDDIFQWRDTVYYVSGVYNDSYMTVEGCDSVYTLVLTVHRNEGIDETVAEQVKVYPNPTTGQVYFSDEAVEVLVYDASGRMLQCRQHTRQVDLTALPAGLYTLHLSLPTGTATCRIIKR